MAANKRVILKLSGELFQDESNKISFNQYNQVAKTLIKIFQNHDVELAIVVGGGNIFRGRSATSQVDHNEADSMGMLSTIINGIGLREALVRNGATETRLMTSIAIPEFAEPYIRLKGRHHLSRRRIVIIAGGLGIPNFSTDSALAQYADELQCDIILKASTIDGVYEADPRQNPGAQKYAKLSFKEAFDKKLAVMDRTAFALCESSKIPIFIFSIEQLARISDLLCGDYSFGSLIS